MTSRRAEAQTMTVMWLSLERGHGTIPAFRPKCLPLLRIREDYSATNGNSCCSLCPPLGSSSAVGATSTAFFEHTRLCWSPWHRSSTLWRSCSCSSYRFPCRLSRPYFSSVWSDMRLYSCIRQLGMYGSAYGVIVFHHWTLRESLCNSNSIADDPFRFPSDPGFWASMLAPP